MTSPTLEAIPMDDTLVAAAQTSKAWPFEEARKIVKRLNGKTPDKPVLFETGYGPSGLPHIGTFGEVARTSMVRNAFRLLTQDKIATRLLSFSDDMDGLRKVPDNVPNKEQMTAYLGQPLSVVPDPFGSEHGSFGAANNARLRAFLDGFGFDYEFASSTEYYKSGVFDETLLKMLAVYDDIMNIILPTLGPDRRATYSPFLPICKRTGVVLQVPMEARNVEAGTISYRDPETSELVETPVTGGAVKCQWKADWAMRWAALDVSYEMAGKDLIDSVQLSGKICRALGKRPPEGFNYELFLDESGQKISKSKGNGLTIEDWLSYATPESLSQYMYVKPKTAKRLHFDIIPKTVDEYFSHLASFEGLEADKQLSSPIWHIHMGKAPDVEMPVSFAMLLNLVSASNASDKAVLWGFISRYAPGTNAQSHPKLDQMVDYAVRYFEDFVKPGKVFRTANEQERAALADLKTRFDALPRDADGETIQNEVYAVGKAHEFEPLRGWFQALYQVLLGQDQGPRFGSFTALYGLDETSRLIDEALSGSLVTS
ncbi:lysine--tRNA ligase [Pararhizobium sp. IMCC21322]|uniref:lysine--tRNA ligase n=1 Tax=Pararhizobium sp. IMCC21322 TaxID=3067903 RepID=UPI0027421C7D|nr:lysine--tRNA ligase [Pararhizobium sp. IMCC21322]